MFSGSLRAFDETVRAGSIRKASEVLGVAPSSVSRHIAILENQIGTALFVRRAAGIELTHAGRLVADFARSVLLDFDTLRTDLSDMRGTQRRLLRLALVESVVQEGPVGVVPTLLKKYPTVSFNVRVMPAPQVVEGVRAGLYDVGVTFCSAPASDLVLLARLPEPVVVVTPPDHPLAGEKHLDVRQIAALPLALPDTDFGVRQVFDRACAAHGLDVSPVLSSNVFETLREFVKRGVGLAVLPRHAVSHAELAHGLRVIPLLGPEFRDTTVDVIVLRKRRLPRVVKSFVDELIQGLGATLGRKS